MQITDILAGAQGGQAAANIAKAFGIDPASAEKAIGAVVPQLAGRIERNTLSRGGIADVIEMLGKPGYREVLDNPRAIGSAPTEKLGIDALDQMLWTKDRSRAVAAKAAAETGLSEDVIKKMLPTIAALAVGGLAKGSGAQLGDIVGRLTGSPLPLPGERRPQARPAPPIDEPAGPPPAAPAAPSRPQSGRGDVGRQSPLPVPGDDVRAPRRRPQVDEETPDASSDEEDNPYGDLGDIIRRGGARIPGGQGGGTSGGSPGGGGTSGGAGGDSLGDLVRNILGGLLGFQNSGVLAWILNFLILKIGLPMLRRVLTRTFTGR